MSDVRATLIAVSGTEMRNKGDHDIDCDQIGLRTSRGRTSLDDIPVPKPFDFLP